MSDCRSNCPILAGGFCERHGIDKPKEWVQLCIRRSSYWKAWETGTGPRQIHVPMQSRRVVEPAYNSHIGDILAHRFEAIGIKPVPGCPCKDLQARLNSMTPDAVASDLAGFTVRLRNSTRKWKELKGGIWNLIPVPPLWLCKRIIEDAIKEAKGIIATEHLTDVTEPGK